MKNQINSKRIERKLKKHYQKAAKALTLPPITLTAGEGVQAMIFRPARRNPLVSAAAFALYGVGIASMVILFMLAGNRFGDPMGPDPAGMQPPGEAGKNGTTNSPVSSETSDIPGIPPDGTVLNLSDGFVDDVISDYYVDRELVSMEYNRSLLKRRFPDSAIAIIQLSKIGTETPTIHSSTPTRYKVYYRIRRILEAGKDFSYSENDFLIGATSEKWYFGDDNRWHVRHYNFNIPLTDPSAYYVVHIHGDGSIDVLTSNLDGKHAGLAWDQYTDDVVRREEECLRMYSEQLSEFTAAPSDPPSDPPQPPVSEPSLPDEIAALPEKVRIDITKAYENHFHTRIDWNDRIEYLGSAGGAYGFLDASGGRDTAITEIEIAGVVFKYQCSFDLWVYRNGEILDMKEAYDAGLLTADQIARFAVYHAGYPAEE